MVLFEYDLIFVLKSNVFALQMHCKYIAKYYTVKYMSQSQSISTPPGLTEAIALGEGQTIEFKEAPSKLDKEIVAFANANGGVIFCGVDDSGKVVGTSVANSVRSEIQNIARNCDPQIQIKIEVLSGDVLRVEVPEGKSKPYQCSSGFFMRMGANAQKLKASEIKSLLRSNERFYDSEVCGDALV